MFYKKSGSPEQDEIVICTIKKITYHCVFATLDEYENRDGMIHISEISPGRIRNIRDYVKEGKRVVCKVVRFNEEKNQIDLSLRRVNLQQKINKNKEFKQEEKAEKLLNSVAKGLKKELSNLYKEIGVKLIQKYGSLSYGLQNLSIDPNLIKEFKLDKVLEEALLKTVKEKIKPAEVKISAIISLESRAENGIEIIKEILSKLIKDNVEIKYLGAPKYSVTIKSNDYKTAEQILKDLDSELQELIKKHECNGKIERKK